MARREQREAPPGRWRVVERDRRLEVIDTWTGERLASPRIAEPPPSGHASRWPRLRMLRQTRFDGGGEMTTHRLYDTKAPRTIRLDPGSAAMVGQVQVGLVAAALLFVAAVVAWPWLLALSILPLRAEVRRPVRRWITNWLDRVEREGS